MRTLAVARLAGRRIACAALTAQDRRVRIGGGDTDAAAGDSVLIGDVTGRAAEIRPLAGHMHVEGARGVVERRVEIAVLYPVAATAVVVTGAAGAARGCADIAGDRGQVDRIDELARAG